MPGWFWGRLEAFYILSCSNFTDLVDFEADGSVTSGSLGLDGEPGRRIFELDSEHGVGPGVRVLDLHVEVGKGSAVGHILGDGDLVGFRGG